MILFYISILFSSSFLIEAKAGVLDVLEQEAKDSQFTLDKHLKKNIGLLLPSKKIYKKIRLAFEKNDYNKALQLWSTSFQKTTFSRSSTGQALYAFLMFKNDLKVLGLNHLFNKVDPKKVHFIVYNLWQKNMSVDQDIWNYYIANTLSDRWTDFFDENILFKIGSKKEISVAKDRLYLEYLLKLPIEDKKNDKFYLEWSLALHLIKKGDMNSSTKVLVWLLKKTKDQNKKNTIYLTIARLLHGIGEYKASLHYYNQVQGLSFTWLLAQEEKSWIYYNRGDYAKSFSQASAFTYLSLQDVLTPDMFLILSLSQLKNCDYPNLARTLSYFKKNFSVRQAYLKNILKKKSFGTVKKNLLSAYSSTDKLLSFRKLSLQLKENYNIKNLILLQDFIVKNEMSVAKNFKPLKIKYSSLVKKIDKKIDKKITVFLKKEISQIHNALKQMYLIEIEALYRIHGYHKNKSVLADIGGRSPELSGKDYTVVFPFDGREVWGDEIGDYNAFFSKECPKKSYIL